MFSSLNLKFTIPQQTMNWNSPSYAAKVMNRGHGSWPAHAGTGHKPEYGILWVGQTMGYQYNPAILIVHPDFSPQLLTKKLLCIHYTPIHIRLNSHGWWLLVKIYSEIPFFMVSIPKSNPYVFKKCEYPTLQYIYHPYHPKQNPMKISLISWISLLMCLKQS